MNNKIANIVVSYIDNLTWIDKIAGMTQVARVTHEGDTKIEKRFPISCAVILDDCTEGCYDELMPNSNYSSVVYFEDGSFSFNRQEGKRLYYDSTIRLVAWLNYKKLGGGCGSTGEYILDIIKSLPSFPVTIGSMFGVSFRVVSQVNRSAGIFSQYTFNEMQSQFLMLPFDYFALEIQTTFHIIPECEELNPEGCTEC